ncbi:MAG: YggS family pyridoxal phosphate-dependent enzyme [Thermoleophilia bacterium]|nr:YggS family pyridoxal phosphate-dependent enzyme [Thermoleophilia bacterium]
MPDEYIPDHPPATATADLATWQARLARVRARVNEATIAAGRAADSVTLLPTVKYIELADTALLVAAGATDLAENRLDALIAKQAAVGDLRTQRGPASVSWHYIGRVQSRQVAEIAARVGPTGTIHSLASERAFAKLATAAANGLQLPELLLQVNAADDPAKDGVALEAVERLLGALPESIRIAGFMTMPAFATDPESSRLAFSALRDLRDRLATTFAGRHDLTALSMGTTQDLAVAIAEGATHVRLGRILFSDGE